MTVDRPVCWWCAHKQRPMNDRVIAPVDAVFESICGHDTCPTAVFHGLCLMEFRDDPTTWWFRRMTEAFLNDLRRGMVEGEED